MNSTDDVLLRAKMKLHLRRRSKPIRSKRIDTALIENLDGRQALTDTLAIKLATIDTPLPVSSESQVETLWARLKLHYSSPPLPS